MTLTFYRDYQELFQGCVAYWDGSLTSDGKLQDIIGGYHGTITGSLPLTSVDRFPKRSLLTYNGNVANYISFTGGTAFNLTECTILCWVKCAQLGATQTVISTRADDNQTGWYCGINSTNVAYIETRLNGATSNYITSNTVITANTWYMFGTYLSNSLSKKLGVWVNGAIDESTTSGSSNVAYGTSVCRIGVRFATTRDSPFNGSIGEILVFNRVLSSPEIKMFYDLTKIDYLYPFKPLCRGVE